MRKAVAIGAAPGLIAGIYVFIASFFGLTMENLAAKAVLLHLGIFALAIPLVVVERWSKGVNFRGKPRWAVRSMQALFVFFARFADGALFESFEKIHFAADDAPAAGFGRQLAQREEHAAA